MSTLEDDKRLVSALVAWSGISVAAVSRKAGFKNNTTINRFANGSAKNRISRSTLERLQATFPDFPGWASEEVSADSYVDVDILPSFAGMGGGGTGDGDRLLAKLPRRLIEEDLRGKPSDFLLVDVRGDSMQPKFLHGDQILVDRRDCNPIQPGPFAIWDGDGYVMKLIERQPGRRGWYRIFSSNPDYQPYEVEETEARIMGRAVWFARCL